MAKAGANGGGTDTAGRVEVPVHCRHGRRVVDVAVDRRADPEASRWEVRVVYACAQGCRDRREVDDEPRRIVGSDGRLLPWRRV